MMKSLRDLKMNPKDMASAFRKGVTSAGAVSSSTLPVSNGEEVRKGGLGKWLI
jgi:hypothetical protein